MTDLQAAGHSLGTVPQFALEALLNPLVELSKLPAPARITAARFDGEALVIEASGVASAPADSRAPQPEATLFDESPSPVTR